jgi:hypothetical protein
MCLLFGIGLSPAARRRKDLRHLSGVSRVVEEPSAWIAYPHESSSWKYVEPLMASSPPQNPEIKSLEADETLDGDEDRGAESRGQCNSPLESGSSSKPAESSMSWDACLLKLQKHIQGHRSLPARSNERLVERDLIASAAAAAEQVADLVRMLCVFPP